MEHESDCHRNIAVSRVLSMAESHWIINNETPTVSHQPATFSQAEN